MENDKTIKINIDDKEIIVDEHCAEMVLFLNEIGMKTRMCCQGHDDKNIFRIWFDVDDDTMMKFINKTSQWTEVGVRPLNKERTQFETYRYTRGLQGWLFKRYWHCNGKLRLDWVYQAEGYKTGNKVFPAHLTASRDVASIKAIYKNTDIEKIQEAQQLNANKVMSKWGKDVASLK